jgi:hypothetical protein
MSSVEPLCLVCTRPLEHRDSWPGTIKGRYMCLRCALSIVGFWKGEYDEGVSQEEGVAVTDGVPTPLRNPRKYHHRRSDTGVCSICGAESITLELRSGRAFCAACLTGLDRALGEWRKLKK